MPLIFNMMLLLAVVGPAVPATVSGARSSHALCAFHNNSQLADPGSHFTLPPQTAFSPQECCNICGANSACHGAVLYGNGCFQKTKVLPITPQKPPQGVALVACVLTGESDPRAPCLPVYSLIGSSPYRHSITKAKQSLCRVAFIPRTTDDGTVHIFIC